MKSFGQKNKNEWNTTVGSQLNTFIFNHTFMDKEYLSKNFKQLGAFIGLANSIEDNPEFFKEHFEYLLEQLKTIKNINNLSF